ncbi:class I SAM-dependent methyltransferase [Candidatus Woesearchaeota archaeon]|nr:class I SAM-dependent methyltransferase [Candidatus Woesearchaeota archaeon]
MIQDQDYLWKLQEDDFWHKNKDRILIKLVKKGSLLDIGAGTGSFPIKLAKLGLDVTYIDASKKYHDIAKLKAKKENVKIKFFNDYFPSKNIKGKFDNIVISGFIEHIDDDVKLLRDIYSMLKPNGRMILLTSAYPGLYSNFDKSVGHYRRYSRKDLSSKISSVGFNIKFLKNWDILGIPILILTKLTGKVPVSDDGLNNKLLNYLLDKWFIIFENKMIIPVGLDLIVMAEK